MSARPKILCVDDEADITDTLVRLLRNDFTVLTANTVADAKTAIDQNPDLCIVLTDHRLPGGTGLDILAIAQQKIPEAVRAMLTGQVDLVELAGAINKTVVHRLIMKPWDNEYLKIQMLEALAAHELLKQNFELQRLAITDPVTLLKNHRFFQDQLKIEVARAVRHERSLALIMIDIDHFKTFNDTYGHPAGDRLLREVGSRLIEAVRNLDTVARYGGEEFAILLPDTSAESARLVAERIRTGFASVPFLLSNGNSTLVTVSLGIATCPQHATTAAALVEVADQALYRAKGQGRNQSIVG